MYNEFYENSPKQVTPIQNVKTNSFLSKVYGNFALFLLITAVVSFLTAMGFGYWISAAGEDQTPYTALFITVGVCGVTLFILSFVMNVLRVFSKRSVLVPAILYSICMGGLLSIFVLLIPSYIIASAFGITALTFVLMFVIAKFSKSNMNWAAVFGIGLLFGAMMLSLFFFIFYLIMPELFSWIYVIIDGAIFLAVLLLTMFDVAQINRMAERGIENKNLALYCAFNLYVDFIYIFIRILYILVRIFGNSKK